MEHHVPLWMSRNKRITCKIVIVVLLIFVLCFLLDSRNYTDSLEHPPPLEPWGYNKKRNKARMLAIKESILHDTMTRDVGVLSPFFIVDYGSDQGYFSISLAMMFPSAHVMSVELGGVGGEIWKKDGDVLALQDKLIDSMNLAKQVQICQTALKPEFFERLNTANLRVHYQLVLSMFHWFDLKSKAEFQYALVQLFLNANIATFIELPVLGDNSGLIRKQVGYNNFKRWYEGSGGDVRNVIVDAIQAYNLSANVVSISKVPWLRWFRELYRVELIGERGPLRFGCRERRRIYGCVSRHRHSICTDSEE